MAEESFLEKKKKKAVEAYHLRDQLMAKIAETQKHVEELEEMAQQYYSAFWTKKSQRDCLINPKNAFYTLKKGEKLSPADQIKLKSLEKDIEDIFAELKQVDVEQYIKRMKEHLENEKKSFIEENILFFAMLDKENPSIDRSDNPADRAYDAETAVSNKI